MLVLPEPDRAGPPRTLAELPASELEDVFRTNVFGAFLCSREAARRLSTANGGRGGAIVTLSSAHAVNTGAPGNWVHFAASKASLQTMSRGLARELAGQDIRVNVIRPGVIATETRLGQPKDHLDRTLRQVPLARMGTPDEVAAAVLWLLSGASGESRSVTSAMVISAAAPSPAGIRSAR